MPLWHCCGGIFISRLVAGSCPFTYKSSKDMPLVFGKSLYLHTLFFYRYQFKKLIEIDMSKILIIDDEVQIRTLLTRMMELEGYDVCQAGDCRAALKQLELQNPDVVLCDVFLPDGNGGDWCWLSRRRHPMWKLFC